MHIQDETIRQQALDIAQSFIVQAPAGSGKTELLTQRYLALLGQAVETPEEILAITFTRKAANEMRQRILLALKKADTQPEPESMHEKKTYYLAKKVLEANERNAWHLLANPNRLQVTTIDAFCFSIINKLPLSAKCGIKITISDRPHRYYIEAIQGLFQGFHHETELKSHIINFLKLVDNDYQRAEELLIDMLATREQWLEYASLPIRTALAKLKNSLAALISHAIHKAKSLLARHVSEATLLNYVHFSLSHHPAYHTSSIAHAWLTLSHLPAEEANSLGFWQYLCTLLITRSNSPTFRKKIDISIGFPPEAKSANIEEKTLFSSMKKGFAQLIENLQHDKELLACLDELASLPPMDYYDSPQIQNNIEALFNVLKLSYAYLKVIFNQKNIADFNEIALAASFALTQTDEVSDIALLLDYKLKHILVDEFQDTSKLQFSLLEKLTANWRPDDGRTLFLVGDPMQSIYRFRQAEVGLFLQAQNYGINQLPLTSLVLQCNFRSNQALLAWVNEQFQLAFPQQEDISTGAVSYSPSTAIKTSSSPQQVQWHLIEAGNNQDYLEALAILELIQTCLQRHPEHSIAVLVRKKSQLRELIPLLNTYDIPFQAVDIESLHEKPIIQALLALTCALTHLGDHIAWLGLLRTPFLGLSLIDLEVIAKPLPYQTVLDSLSSLETMENLSAEAKQILMRTLPILQQVIAQRDRYPLRKWVEHTWKALGGEYTLSTDLEKRYAEQYFQLLDEISEDTIDIYKLKSLIYEQYACVNHAISKLQLMTIHKSKGLEFDIVILPGLEESGKNSYGHMLAWHEQPSFIVQQNNDNQSQWQHTDWLLAPMKAIGQEQDLMYEYIQQINRQKIRLEQTRLLYVAATRAKTTLHLFYKCEEQKEKSPAKDSLLYSLWPKHLDSKFSTINYIANATPTIPAELTAKVPTLMRLPTDFQAKKYDLALNETSNNPDISYKFALDKEQIIGTITHQFLKHLVDLPQLQTLDSEEHLTPAIHNALLSQGFTQEELAVASNYVLACLKNTLQDERGRWILQRQHKDSYCEYPLSFKETNGEIRHYIVDRTFVDEQGVRWIIDYKTSNCMPDEKETFLQEQVENYRQQLHNYGKIFSNMENREIRLALYFPHLPEWYTWTYKAEE